MGFGVTPCLVTLALVTIAAAQTSELINLQGDWLRIEAESNAEDDCAGGSCPCLYTRWYVLLGRRRNESSHLHHPRTQHQPPTQSEPPAQGVTTNGQRDSSSVRRRNMIEQEPLEMWVHISRTDVCRGWHSTLTAHATAVSPSARMGNSKFSFAVRAVPPSAPAPSVARRTAGSTGAGVVGGSSAGAASEGRKGLAVTAVGEVLAACTFAFDIDCVAVTVRFNLTAAVSAASATPSSASPPAGGSAFAPIFGRHDFEFPGWLRTTSVGTHCLSIPAVATASAADRSNSTRSGGGGVGRTTQQRHDAGVAEQDADADAPLPGVAAAVSMDGMWLPVPNADLRISFGRSGSGSGNGGDSGLQQVLGSGRPAAAVDAVVAHAHAASGVAGAGADGGTPHAVVSDDKASAAGGGRKARRGQRRGGKAPQRRKPS